MSTKLPSAGPTSQALPKATPAGLLRHMVMWPALIGAIGYSLYAGMNHLLVILAFYLGVAIIIATATVSKEQRAACWAMIVFSIVNAVQIHSDPAQLHQQPQFWFANRMLYAVGLAFWIQPLWGKLFESDTGKIGAIVSGVAFLAVGFIMYYLDRGNGGIQTVQCVSMNVEKSSCTIRTAAKAWYDTRMLYDDVCIGLASGLLYAALTASTKAKKHGLQNAHS